MLNEHRDIMDEIRSTIDGRVEMVMLDLVKYELARLYRAGTSDSSKIAGLVLDSLVSWKVRVVEAPYGPRDVDLVMTIYALTEKSRVIVATVDENLLHALTSNRVPSLRPRHQSGLLASWKT